MEENTEFSSVVPETNRQKSKRLPYVAVFAAVILSVTLAIGLAVGLLVPRSSVKSYKYVQPDALVDCFLKGSDPTKQDCEKLGCDWHNNTDTPGRPMCTYPNDKETVGYRLIGEPTVDAHGMLFNLTRTNTPPIYESVINDITVLVECQDNHRLRIKIYDPNDSRFEVPSINVTNNRVDCNTSLYSISYTTTPHFGIQVSRRATGETIFNSSLPGLAFYDQFLQLTSRLPSSYIYGFGEHNHRRFQHDMNWKKWTIFTRDCGVVDAWNLYGHHPFYMNLENDGNANGVFLMNSNAMDIILQPDPFPAVSYRVIGGILDYYIFLGPTPENIVQQYTEAVGRPMMPPYWSLGFQLSRWDYGNLSNVEEVVRRNREARIPHDVQYGDIDYMYKKLDFTYDRESFDGLPEFIDDLHNNGQRYIIILDPGIGTNPNVTNTAPPNNTYPPLTLGLEKKVFIRDPRNDSQSLQGFLQGEVWPGTVVYPDFTHENATDWWKTLISDFYHIQNIKYDALWIDMNEPSSFKPGSLTGCDKNKHNFPPYVPNILGHWPDGRMFDKTVCMDAVSSWGIQYNTHSLYGHSMSIVTYNAMKRAFPTKRPMVLTRSSFSGTGKYAGHWLGDNQSRWPQLAWSITGMLEFNLFGFPYIGADICGFWFDTTEEMCKRWMLLGAFYPFARNHNAKGDDGKPNFMDQDPAAFGEDMIRLSRDILHTRYRLLPFLYTLFHHAHVEGTTVVRPLFHEFTEDKSTWAIDKQFLWGPSLMISPALSKGQTEVEAYFPKARWYDFFDLGHEVSWTQESRTLNTPIDKINVHLRGGYIIPWQESALTTTHSRNKSMGVTVALDETNKAVGSLFWDDGESFEAYTNDVFLMVNFTFEVDTLTFRVSHNGYPAANTLMFDSVDVWGLKRKPTRVQCDNQEVESTKISYYPTSKSLSLTSLRLNVTVDHVISWGHYI